ncbi:MAG: sulfotransferase [Planctomycetota bacterium]
MSSSPRVRYLIVGMARSGTTATHHVVYGHPAASAMHDEGKVDPLFTQGVSTFAVGGRNPQHTREQYAALFDLLTLHAPGPGATRAAVTANGMKVVTQAPAEAGALVDCLVESFPDARIVHVRRGDLLAQFASLERASRTGVWHTRHASPSGPRAGAGVDDDAAPRPLDAARFARYLETCAAVEAQLLRLRRTHRVHEVSYERDILPNDPARAAALFEFLGLPAVPPTWMQLTKTSPPLETFVSNVAELRAVQDEQARR